MSAQPQHWAADMNRWGWWQTNGVGAGLQNGVMIVGDSTRGGGGVIALEGFAPQFQTTVSVMLDSIPAAQPVTFGMSDINGNTVVGHTVGGPGGSYEWIGTPSELGAAAYPYIGIAGDGAFTVISWTVDGFIVPAPPAPPPAPPQFTVVFAGKHAAGVRRL